MVVLLSYVRTASSLQHSTEQIPCVNECHHGILLMTLEARVTNDQQCRQDRPTETTFQRTVSFDVRKLSHIFIHAYKHTYKSFYH